MFRSPLCSGGGAGVSEGVEEEEVLGMAFASGAVRESAEEVDCG